MKLNQVKNVNYNITEDLAVIIANRVINEIKEDGNRISASWYVLNESTGYYEINELLVNEGIKDIMSKGIGKVNDAITKGYSDIDAIKTKVIQGLKSKGDPGVLSKLGEIAKKNAKYIKPALMVAVVGASLLGMDTASANETLNQVTQMQPDEFQQYKDQLNQQLQDTKSNQTDAFQDLNKETKGGQQAQSPQEDQPKQYPGGTGAGGNGDETIMKVVKFGKQRGADTEALMRALQNLKVDGMPAQDFAAKAEQSGNDKAWMEILSALEQSGKDNGQAAQGGGGGGTTTTTTSSSTISGDGKGGWVDQNGKPAQAPQHYDSATGKFVDSKVNDSRRK